MKKYLRYARIAVFVIAVIAVFLVVRQRKEIRRVENNYSVRTREYQDLQGRTVLQTEAYEVKLKELRKASRLDSAYRTEQEQKLAYAQETIKTLGKKLNQVQSVNTIEVESKKKDTVFIKVKGDSIIIESLKSKHWNIDFTVKENKIMVADMTYSAKIDIVIDRERRRKPDGSKRFVLCRLIKPNYVYSSSVVCDDPDAKIKSNVLIKFK